MKTSEFSPSFTHLIWHQSDRNRVIPNFSAHKKDCLHHRLILNIASNDEHCLLFLKYLFKT